MNREQKRAAMMARGKVRDALDVAPRASVDRGARGTVTIKGPDGAESAVWSFVATRGYVLASPTLQLPDDFPMLNAQLIPMVRHDLAVQQMAPTYEGPASYLHDTAADMEELEAKARRPDQGVLWVGVTPFPWPDVARVLLPLLAVDERVSVGVIRGVDRKWRLQFAADRIRFLVAPQSVVGTEPGVPLLTAEEYQEKLAAEAALESGANAPGGTS